ncbi:aldo/keto reductase [Variovorax sp. MHTC-1]|uniref:aldo/keto reductase n=1 Tax=Variovorax sp. MHTC-1 TaxID=2495593 RepID=UPI000F894BEE|nr:aldo/keto reductase [Variovorax sp. MHTC-1]RST48212.1 hypothetical protein EJI01_27055 [Variovorax sp. MHTC-1]
MTRQYGLGVGGVPLGNLFSALSDADAQTLMQAALADGCVCFDTAPHYGSGLSEHRFAMALRHRRRGPGKRRKVPRGVLVVCPRKAWVWRLSYWRCRHRLTDAGTRAA